MNAISSCYNFCSNLIWLRKYHKLPKHKMAKMLNISIWTLRKLEHYILPSHLKIDILLDIYKQFGISPTTMLTHRLQEDTASINR